MSRLLVLVLFTAPLVFGQQAQRPDAKNEPLPPDWCQKLPRPGYKNLERMPVQSDWFEVYRVRPGVFAVYEQHQYEEVISYLVLGSKRALLFDTGLRIGNIREVADRLTNLPVTVLNSHTHIDHIGGNWQFSNVLGTDTSYTRSNTRGASHAELEEIVRPERLCGSWPKKFEPASYSIPAFRVASVVKDGDVIDLGGRKLEVLHIPGHTPDSLALLDRKNKLLFTGDTFYAGTIFLYVPESDVPAYKSSIQRLATLVPQLDLLLPGHNFPAEQPQMLIRLVQAFQEIESGKAKFVVDQGRRDYKFDEFSILMAAPK
ncbi:MAG: MBL fold metallo-hydrolase [Acidobacteriales bacterium]|nr:MBL fold metallo-hydrolase [Terriglobales bacterium]